MGVKEAIAQQESRAAFVIIERTATTGDESIQEEYAKLAREILPKYGARYLARSQRNTLLAPFSYCGVGIKPFSVGVPCRIIVLSAVSVSRRNMASEALASGCQLRGRSDFR